MEDKKPFEDSIEEGHTKYMFNSNHGYEQPGEEGPDSDSDVSVCNAAAH